MSLTNGDAPGRSEKLPRRSRAWLGHSLWNCDEGFLELSTGRLRFITRRGDVQFEADATQCAASIPRGSAGTGLRRRTPSAVYRIWFSKPVLRIRRPRRSRIRAICRERMA